MKPLTQQPRPLAPEGAAPHKGPQKETVMDVMEWAGTAQPGERVVYAERGHGAQLVGQKADALDAARMAHECGLVFLAQKKDSWGYEYVATRISRRTAQLLGLVPLNRGEQFR